MIGDPRADAARVIAGAATLFTVLLCSVVVSITGVCLGVFLDGLCRARTRTIALSWCFLCSLCRPAIFVDQAVDDVGARDPGGHIDRLAGLVQRRSLFPRLVRPMTVVMP
jgi:hypothetical protein